MFSRVREKSSINNIPVDWKVKNVLEELLWKINKSSELYRSINYILEKWTLWSVLVADEFLRGVSGKTNSDIHKLFLSEFENIFIDTMTDYWAYKKLWPDVNSLEECRAEWNKILKDLRPNRKIIAHYDDIYYYDFFNKEQLFGVDIELSNITMNPKLTTWYLIDQVFEYLKLKELSNYQIIDIGTGETNFIPKVIKNYQPSVEVLWFDIEMMFDNNWKKDEWDFWSWNKIQPYVSQKKSLIITANLPYSPEEDIQNFDPLVQQESKNVWYRSFKWWWKDGLDLYRMYIDDISSDKENLPKIRLMVFEALEKNITTLESYIKEKIPWIQTSLHKNYKDENRILRIEL